MANYNAYVRANKRKILCEVGISLERALDFLSETKNALVVSETGEEYIKEELKYAESIRPSVGVGEDSGVTSGGTVHEDTDPELFDFTEYYSQPGTERDS